MSAAYSADDYARALSALRPRGRVWPDDPSSVQGQVFAGCAQSLERLDGAAQALLIDAFPSTTAGLLPEWQQSLGLPDPYIGDGATLSQRQAQIVAKLTAPGGQSQQTFIDYAASLGFTITVQTFAPFRCGLNGCGDEVGGAEWTVAWGVTVQSSSRGLPNSVLLQELNLIRPAQTTVFLQG